MRIKKRFFFVFAVLALFAIFFWQVPIYSILTFPQDVVLFNGDLTYINETKQFGNFVTLTFSDDGVHASKDESGTFVPEVEFKLFNLIPIKKQKVTVVNNKKIFAGGIAVGIVLNSEGVLVVGSSPIVTDAGEYFVEKESIIKIGDTILSIAGEKIEDTSSITQIINKEENKNKELVIVLKRAGQQISTKIKPVFDVKNKIFRLGVWVRDDASGIGTLTYIDEDNNFGALGHPICDGDTKTIVNAKDGKIYNCTIMGVNKGSNGAPGEIRGLFLQGKNEQGDILNNNEYGVYGKVKDDCSLFKHTKEYVAGGRLTVLPGKAKIRCCIDGTNVEDYEIEIIKTNYQNYSNDKSMVIKVTDKRLIEKTGGIVQGMSGSPIIQNDKLVGAITHVFVNDPTKGFGIYLDWMVA